MSRLGTQEQNDIPLIIGALPKRLQNKFAANCCNIAVEDAENAVPDKLTILRKSCVKDKCNGLMGPVMDTSGSTTSSQLSSTSSSSTSSSSSSTLKVKDVAIPGILRVSAIEQVKTTDKNRANNHHGGRRRARGQHQLKSQSPPSSVVRLTTEHPEWFEKFVDMPDTRCIIQLYDQLMVLQQRNLILINWKNFCYLHDQLQDAFKQLVLKHLKLVCEHKIDAFFWKLLFYNVREHLKRNHSSMAQTHTLLLIEQTIKFYNVLYDKLQAQYKSGRSGGSAMKVVGQRLLICLGDLTRYRISHLQLPDYTDASKYYRRAQELMPANGAPYNQLAIISIYHHNRFDAVYYYMRSLLSLHPIQTAKESLLDLFDEIRRRYEDNEMKQSPMHRSLAVTPKKTKQMRKEVWIYPDGVRRLHRTDCKGKLKNKTTVAEVNRYEEMTSEELVPRILSLYLYLIGKLYTGIDVECLYQQLQKLHTQMTAALKNGNLLSRSKLLKMVALNIFVIENNNRKGSRREMRYHSFNFSNSMFGLMLSKVNQQLTVLTESNATDLECSELNNHLQFILIYLRWLTINVELWEPVRTEEHSFIDCWSELQMLFDHVNEIRNKFTMEADQPTVILDENLMLNGFCPLRCDIVTKDGSSSTGANERMQFFQRINDIAKYQNLYMKHQETLQLSFDSSFTIEELNSNMAKTLNEFEVQNCAKFNDTAAVLAAASKPEEQPVDADISHLCKLKRELEAKAKAQKICDSKLEEILQFVDTKLYIEVRPRYLLPDTNCFIDCLEDIEKLSLEFKRYTIIIPLTVVKELDGLSKGVKLESYRNSYHKHRIHHFDEVSTRAKKSLDFIKSAKNNIKCTTTKGSAINASMFGLVEEDYASNDDKILATAVAVSKTVSTEQCKDGKCFIQTELVLITTDRNLRVKALARNLAVSALDEFLQWAKDCREAT